MYVRKAEIEDKRFINEIMAIYRNAQDYMIASGNPDQWSHIYPTEEMILGDIDRGVFHMVLEGDRICGVAAVFEGEDITYRNIYDGRWLNDEPYVTIHRIAGDGKTHGIFSCVASWCKTVTDNIRIDTHKRNLTMQRQILKNGFTRCGTIYVEDGTLRIAYQWTK